MVIVLVVQNSNVVKITDFGLAKLLDSNEDVFKAAGGKVGLRLLCCFVSYDRVLTKKCKEFLY